MSGTQWPGTDPDSWETLQLGSHKLPGRWTVHGFTQRARGKRGTAQLRFESCISKTEHAAFASVRPSLEAARRNKTPLVVIHPQATFLSVDAILIRRIRIRESTNAGAAQVLIEAVAWWQLHSIKTAHALH